MEKSFVENYGNLSDNVIVERIKNGDYELFAVIIHRYMPKIKFYAFQFAEYGFEADDLMQEGTLALYSAVKGYREGKASFSTFAQICVKRAMLDVVKAAGRKCRIPDKLISSLDDGLELEDANNPEKIVLDKESYRQLTDTIRLELSEMEYNILRSFLVKKNYSDVANELGVSVKSVDNSLRRIRTKLKPKK